MQAMKLFMGAVAMASALEVDTESGPNKIQVAAQPGNAGVVSKTIKLATAAGVSAMAVEAINKLGTFETSPSGDGDNCAEKDNNGVCILCDVGFFLTTSNKCATKCPEGTESPIYCPYQYCVLNGQVASTGTNCAKAKTTASSIKTFAGQCATRAELKTAGTPETCTYCSYATNGNNFIDSVTCDLNVAAETYDLARVAAEVESFPKFAKYNCDASAMGGAMNCIKDIFYGGQSLKELSKAIGDSVLAYAPEKVEDRGLLNFGYGFNGAGPLTRAGGQCLCKAFSRLAVGATEVTFNNSPLITSLADLCSKTEAEKITELVRFTTDPSTNLAKLPATICDIKREGSNGKFKRLLFATSAACTTAQGALQPALLAAGVTGCTGAVAPCCDWDTKDFIAAGCSLGAADFAQLFD